MIKAQIDANGNRTEFRYDELGFQIAATIMLLNQRSTMTYDEVDNLHSMTDFNGRSITYVYDEQNRLTEKQFQDGSKVQSFTFSPTRSTQTSWEIWQPCILIS